MLVNVRIEIVNYVPNDRTVGNTIAVATEDVSMKCVLVVAADGPVHHLEMIWMHVEEETVAVMQDAARISVIIVVEAK